MKAVQMAFDSANLTHRVASAVSQLATRIGLQRPEDKPKNDQLPGKLITFGMPKLAAILHIQGVDALD
jgi:hypothetical protein